MYVYIYIYIYIYVCVCIYTVQVSIKHICQLSNYRSNIYVSQKAVIEQMHAVKVPVEHKHAVKKTYMHTDTSWVLRNETLFSNSLRNVVRSFCSSSALSTLGRTCFRASFGISDKDRDSLASILLFSYVCMCLCVYVEFGASNERTHPSFSFSGICPSNLESTCSYAWNGSLLSLCIEHVWKACRTVRQSASWLCIICLFVCVSTLGLYFHVSERDVSDVSVTEALFTCTKLATRATTYSSHDDGFVYRSNAK
jgi:hypothetical protein